MDLPKRDTLYIVLLINAFGFIHVILGSRKHILLIRTNAFLRDKDLEELATVCSMLATFVQKPCIIYKHAGRVKNNECWTGHTYILLKAMTL